MRVVATAGHVDHGKSSLVLALTGTDPDRFPEEKARGLTIDLGFAFATLPSGTVVGFVDVPGHVRFVRNMLAGVAPTDVALLVVAATEGWMPQTEEHVRILELLGIEHGVVALAKADVVDEETLALARLDVEERLATTAFGRWPIVAVDSVSGRGVDEVATALDALLATVPSARDDDRPRLWIDRVFTVRGAGTVVTGTLTGGSLALDDPVIVEPGARPARVRGIESHHEQLTRVIPGSRVALNLAGIDHHGISRGDVVVLPQQWAPTDVFDVALRPLTGITPARRTTLDVHAGSGHRRASLRVLDDGGHFARIRLAEALPLAPGDRLVLRSPARQETVGGVEVLDIEPARGARDAVARLTQPLARRVMMTRPWARPSDIEVLAGTSRAVAEQMARDLVAAGDAVAVGEWIVEREELARVVDGAHDLVARHHREHPADAGIAIGVAARALQVERAELRAALAHDEHLVVERDVVREPSHRGAAEQDEGRRLLAALEAEPFAPPSPGATGADPSVVRALLRDGSATELDGVVFATTAVDAAREIVATLATERGEVTIAELRDALGSTRKYVMPLVHRFDAEGVTRRRGDLRVPGPRAAGIRAQPSENGG